MTERIIQREVRKLFINYEYQLCNTFLFAWQSDFFCLSKSGYSTEVEVKCTKGDFRKDFTKLDKHHLFTNYKKPAVLRVKRPFKPWLRPGEAEYVYRPGDSSYVTFCCPADHLPNKFFYACPEGLIKLEECPAYAGLIYVEEYTNNFGTGYKIREVKPAPFLHKLKKDHRHDLLQKYYWKAINDRRNLMIMLGGFENGCGPFTDKQTDMLNEIKDKFLY